MKHLSKLLLASFMLLSFTAVQAQDENNPWAIGIGLNAVDFYPTGQDAPLGGYFENFFNTGDHWNILPGISRLSVARYLGGGFHFEAAGSVNQISKFGDESWNDITYYGLDGTFNYSFGADDGWLDPVVGVGGGYIWVDDQGALTLDGTAGLNFWFSDHVALTLQTVYKYSFGGYGGTGEGTNQDYTGGNTGNGISSHFQHVAGIKFAFGGVDTDGDGIYDENDECPEAPGLLEFNGCPDSDGDGIEDRADACPNEAGLIQYDGCPDTDGDGVADPLDECPTVAGLELLEGCPDADGDGIRDSEDECVNEAGPAENNGCPYEDADNDGVLDKDDQCPDVAGTVANNGCPEVSVEVINELNEYSRSVLFDLNKATIRNESQETLESIAQIMEEYPNTTFNVEGYTDSTGTEEYNEGLSRRRAQSVVDGLIDLGISADRLSAEGYGEADPIATNQTAEGRQQNRRVEITLEENEDM